MDKKIEKLFKQRIAEAEMKLENTGWAEYSYYAGFLTGIKSIKDAVLIEVLKELNK